MALQKLQLPQIFSGTSAAQYLGSEGTYNSSTAVDPDLPIVSTDIRTSGFCVPVGYAKFSGTNVNAPVIRLITNPKNNLTYAITTSGRLISYNSSLSGETLVGTVSGGAATWGEYYNNYIYIFTPTDVSRYGPLNGSPSLTDNWWTSTLGLTALTNTTYPSLRSVSMPNHVAHVHGDNALYFCDFANGQGIINKISTYKVTNEGDTNNPTVPSTYNALDLPFGFYPTAIESTSTSVMIIGNYTNDSTINQGRAAFILWDPTDTVSFYLGPIPFADPLATAILTANGTTYIWTGNAKNGVRLSRYTGGENVEDVVFLEEGLPPLAGAVDALGNRIVWGGFSTNPSAGAVVWAWGSKDARLPQGLHNIAKTSSSGTTPFTTALKYIQQDSNITPKVVPAWNDGSGAGIDQYSTSATLAAKIRWMINLGERFEVRDIKIPLAGAVDANTTIIVTLYQDDLSSSVVLPTINNTNYAGKRYVSFKGEDLKDTGAFNNCILELAWTGTTPLAVGLPITLKLETELGE